MQLEFQENFPRVSEFQKVEMVHVNKCVVVIPADFQTETHIKCCSNCLEFCPYLNKNSSQKIVFRKTLMDN